MRFSLKHYDTLCASSLHSVRLSSTVSRQWSMAPPHLSVLLQVSLYLSLGPVPFASSLNSSAFTGLLTTQKNNKGTQPHPRPPPPPLPPLCFLHSEWRFHVNEIVFVTYLRFHGNNDMFFRAKWPTGPGEQTNKQTNDYFNISLINFNYLTTRGDGRKGSFIFKCSFQLTHANDN